MCVVPEGAYQVGDSNFFFIERESRNFGELSTLKDGWNVRDHLVSSKL